MTAPADTIRQAEELAEKMDGWRWEEADTVRALIALAEPQVAVVAQLREMGRACRDKSKNYDAGTHTATSLHVEASAYNKAADLLTQAMGEPPAGEGGVSLEGKSFVRRWDEERKVYAWIEAAPPIHASQLPSPPLPDEGTRTVTWPASRVPAILEELFAALGGRDAPLSSEPVTISGNLAHGLIAALTAFSILAPPSLASSDPKVEALVEFADLCTVIERIDPDFPNYASWYAELPAGHWRAILATLTPPAPTEEETQ